MLIQRRDEPFQDHWALAGGFVDIKDGEKPHQAAARELLEETGVEGLDLIPVCFAAGADRDPRGYTATAVYAAVVEREAIKPKAGDDARDVRWFDIDQVLKEVSLAFDHKELIQNVVQRLGIKTT
jgi:8-oxo-dGTP diphosphatase